MKSGSVRSSFQWIALISAAASVLTGCQTSSKHSAPLPEPEPAPRVAAPFDFSPQAYLAPIETGQVRYRMLYAPESHAIWLTDEVNGMKLDADRSQGIVVDDRTKLTAEIAQSQFIVIECRLESAFADSSVAYDVVGMRNMDVYMETPSGERILPVQRIMAPHADEEAEGALIRFGRTSVLVFPKRDVLTQSPSALSGAPGVRLVLEGFHSSFYFEWDNAGELAIVEASDVAPRTGSVALEAIRTGYTSIYSLLSPLQRIVD